MDAANPGITGLENSAVIDYNFTCRNRVDEGLFKVKKGRHVR